MTQSLTLALGGASGAVYGLRFLEQCLRARVHVSLLITRAGRWVIRDETGWDLPASPKQTQAFLIDRYQVDPKQLVVYGQEDWSSPLASGTSAPKAMVVCPCSVGCLSAIALSMNDQLLERAADVVIKEQGKLILVVREMPLSSLHLTHMLTLAQLGVCIMPASPGFYFRPQTIEDLVDFVVARLLDHLQIAHHLSHRWGEASK